MDRQVVEVAIELIEAVGSGQVPVAVAEVVLAELAGGVALFLQKVGDGGCPIGHAMLGARHAGLRVSGGCQPIRDQFVEFFRGQSRMGGHRHLDQCLLAAGEGGLEIALENRGERLLGFPFGMLRRELLDAVEDLEGLEIDRLL